MRKYPSNTQVAKPSWLKNSGSRKSSTISPAKRLAPSPLKSSKTKRQRHDSDYSHDDDDEDSDVYED